MTQFLDKILANRGNLNEFGRNELKQMMELGMGMPSEYFSVCLNALIAEQKWDAKVVLSADLAQEMKNVSTNPRFLFSLVSIDNNTHAGLIAVDKLTKNVIFVDPRLQKCPLPEFLAMQLAARTEYKLQTLPGSITQQMDEWGCLVHAIVNAIEVMGEPERVAYSHYWAPDSLRSRIKIEKMAKALIAIYAENTVEARKKNTNIQQKLNLKYDLEASKNSQAASLIAALDIENLIDSTGERSLADFAADYELNIEPDDHWGHARLKPVSAAVAQVAVQPELLVTPKTLLKAEYHCGTDTHWINKIAEQCFAYLDDPQCTYSEQQKENIRMKIIEVAAQVYTDLEKASSNTDDHNKILHNWNSKIESTKEVVEEIAVDKARTSITRNPC